MFMPHLFCRGFVVGSCIVVQHVGHAGSGNGSVSPAAKRPCPEVQVGPKRIYLSTLTPNVSYFSLTDILSKNT